MEEERASPKISEPRPSSTNGNQEDNLSPVDLSLNPNSQESIYKKRLDSEEIQENWLQEPSENLVANSQDKSEGRNTAFSVMDILNPMKFNGKMQTKSASDSDPESKFQYFFIVLPLTDPSYFSVLQKNLMKNRVQLPSRASKERTKSADNNLPVAKNGKIPKVPVTTDLPVNQEEPELRLLMNN